MIFEEMIQKCARLAELCEQSPEAKEAMLLTIKILYEQPARPAPYVLWVPVHPWWILPLQNPIWISNLNGTTVVNTTTNARLP
jgi:hypothetical protein